MSERRNGHHRFHYPAFMLLAVLSCALLLTERSGSTQSARLSLTHGVASGDVTARSAVIWARANAEALVIVEAATDSEFRRDRVESSRLATEETDFTAQLTLHGLEPDTRYWYRVVAGGRSRAEDSDPVIGNFKTAPTAAQSRIVSFTVR